MELVNSEERERKREGGGGGVGGVNQQSFVSPLVSSNEKFVRECDLKSVL